jgi:hypothetical protein
MAFRLSNGRFVPYLTSEQEKGTPKDMQAYKFRSAAQIAFALDIVFKQRLHCSDWSTLNDPMEGRFRYEPFSPERVQYAERLQQIIDGKKAYRVCSLSKTYHSRLLWAHYASGFDGLAIEVELPIEDDKGEIHDMIYQDRLPTVDLKRNLQSKDKALSILTHKHTEWSYEEEIRIIKEKHEWYKLSTPVKCIIVGHRFNEALLEALRIVCEQKGISLKGTRVQKQGVVAVELRGSG